MLLLTARILNYIKVHRKRTTPRFKKCFERQGDIAERGTINPPFIASCYHHIDRLSVIPIGRLTIVPASRKLDGPFVRRLTIHGGKRKDSRRDWYRLEPRTCGRIEPLIIDHDYCVFSATRSFLNARPLPCTNRTNLFFPPWRPSTCN